MQIYRQGDYMLVLEPALCKGCNLCVYSCPVGILHLSARGKIATTPEAVAEKCIFCRICEMRCPDFAIWVVKPFTPFLQKSSRTSSPALKEARGGRKRKPGG